MSDNYDEYIIEHKNNVKKAFEWLKQNTPEIFNNELLNEVTELIKWHDDSKYLPDEYVAYDAYFYGLRSYQVVKDFDYAWLLHMHRNPHHWQYWILTKDDPNEENVLIEMPDCYMIEMICDWWSFSFKKGDLNEIFKWYNIHKDHIQLNEITRNKIENILGTISNKLKQVQDTFNNNLSSEGNEDE